jgi:hypothetical protein
VRDVINGGAVSCATDQVHVKPERSAICARHFPLYERRGEKLFGDRKFVRNADRLIWEASVSPSRAIPRLSNMVGKYSALLRKKDVTPSIYSYNIAIRHERHRRGVPDILGVDDIFESGGALVVPTKVTANSDVLNLDPRSLPHDQALFANLQTLADEFGKGRDVADVLREIATEYVGRLQDQGRLPDRPPIDPKP